MTTRRSQGDGSIYQRHDPKTCPPAVKGVRPEHRCQGLWVSEINMGHVNGKRQRKTLYGKTRAEVGRKLTKAKAEYNANQLVMNAPTVKVWFAYWLDEIAANRVKPKTLKEYRSKVRLYLDPTIGQHRIDKLEPAHVRGLYNGMRKRGLAEATLRQTHAILHRGLVDAMRDGKVSRNVTDLVDPPTTYTKKTIPLTVEQVRKVLAQARGTRLESRWFVALYLGLRQSEALGLRWENVDLDKTRIYINETTWGAPKSRAGKRVIPMLAPDVIGAMRRRWVAYLHERQEPGYIDNGLVWCQPNGKPLDPAKDYHDWCDLLAAAGVPHVALRAARNTAASMMGDVGGHDRLVADMLGHAQVAMTNNIYQSADEAQYQRVQLALGAYINPPPTPTP